MNIGKDKGMDINNKQNKRLSKKDIFLKKFFAVIIFT